MDALILYDTDPSPETVRRWGYDKQLLLLDQDEDLILHDVRYVPVLVELAADPNCPKAGYALGIVEQYCRFVLDWRHRHLAEPIAAVAGAALASPSVAVRGWAEWFRQEFAAMA